MHLVRFRDPRGTVRYGQWQADRREISADPEYETRIGVEREVFDFDEVTVLPPCQPSKIVCIGLNYADHAAEQDLEVPDRPMLFLKPPNAVAAHGQTIELLPGKDRIDYEAELAVVIAEQCRNVAAENAGDVIAGFTCMDDVSNRDDQQIEQNWVRGKAFDDAAPLGPVIATPEEVPADASIRLRVDGETRQDSSRANLIFQVPELVAEITRYLTLQPGDVIATGTPAGVGPLSDGDVVEIEVEGVGTLRHDVVIPDDTP